ncbi:hypothetical protein ACP70R_025990 [Stipagrostis hirtigluma subsp. patula]
MAADESAPDKKNSAAGSSEIAHDMSPFLIEYKDGSVKRLIGGTSVPASEVPGKTGVSTRDVDIDPGTGLSARLFLNVDAAVEASRRLPLVVYFHGGAFCTGSPFVKLFHRYAESLCARAGALVVSVDYRLAPEHPIPAAYDDASAALRWSVSLADAWLDEYADPGRTFLAGESAGANIVHNVAMHTAAAPDGGGDVDIAGVILLQPFFWGPERLPSEMNPRSRSAFAPEWVDTLWSFLTAGAAGNEDPRLNPAAEEVASLPCRRALVAVAGEDVARDRGRRYARWLGRGGERRREVTLLESEGEDHGFHLLGPKRATAVALMDGVVEFIRKEPPMDFRSRGSVARSALAVGRPTKARGPSFRVEQGRFSCTKIVRWGPFAPWRTVANRSMTL